MNTNVNDALFGDDAFKDGKPSERFKEALNHSRKGNEQIARLMEECKQMVKQSKDNLRKNVSSLQKEVNVLKTYCKEYQQKLIDMKHENVQTDKFIQALLSTGRTSKEELKQYFKKRIKRSHSKDYQKVRNGN